MEKTLIETAKKSPIITAALTTLIWIFSLILEKDIPHWLLALIATLTFCLTTIVIVFNSKKIQPDQAAPPPCTSTNISDQEISDVETEGGDFTLGAKNTAGDKVGIKNNKIDKVNTGGGDFTIGSKGD